MVLEALALGSLGVGVYQATQSKKPDSPKAPSPVVAPVDDTADRKPAQKYRPAAQVFGDDEFKLGLGGKLGA